MITYQVTISEPHVIPSCGTFWYFYRLTMDCYNSWWNITHHTTWHQILSLFLCNWITSNSSICQEPVWTVISLSSLALTFNVTRCRNTWHETLDTRTGCAQIYDRTLSICVEFHQGISLPELILTQGTCGNECVLTVDCNDSWGLGKEYVRRFCDWICCLCVFVFVFAWTICTTRARFSWSWRARVFISGFLCDGTFRTYRLINAFSGGTWRSCLNKILKRYGWLTNTNNCQKTNKN